MRKRINYRQLGMDGEHRWAMLRYWNTQICVRQTYDCYFDNHYAT